MELIKMVNAGFRFVLELCLLVVFGYWGWRTGENGLLKVLLGVGAPVLAAAAWGMFLAPKSAMRLHEPWLFLGEVVLFGLAVWALAGNSRIPLAIAFGLVYSLNKILLLIWKQS
ncbi:MAG: YrdB family protein [Caldilineaceae bacterium]|nr:YrdB family protein [Anaerolineales bacterium]MCB0144778.1 YrdB family protein [Caldilineaceae bacterium]MCB8950271.1 YrdB family protein [Ardenticatenaceae bacterium]